MEGITDEVNGLKKPSQNANELVFNFEIEKPSAKKTDAE